MKSTHEFSNDGMRALEYVISGSAYGSLEQAVASLSVFTHPSTVQQLNGKNLFQTIRGKRGRMAETEFGTVMEDDNKSPTDAFIWLHGWKRGHFKDVQFNHIWTKSKSVKDYTNLANVVVTPSFLAKVTDTNNEIVGLLRYRAFDLFGYKPQDEITPKEPKVYRQLSWSSPLPEVSDVERTLRVAMSTKQKDRTTRTARELGWLFSDFHPDPTV